MAIRAVLHSRSYLILVVGVVFNVSATVFLCKAWYNATYYHECPSHEMSNPNSSQIPSCFSEAMCKTNAKRLKKLKTQMEYQAATFQRDDNYIRAYAPRSYILAKKELDPLHLDEKAAQMEKNADRIAVELKKLKPCPPSVMFRVAYFKIGVATLICLVFVVSLAATASKSESAEYDETYKEFALIPIAVGGMQFFASCFMGMYLSMVYSAKYPCSSSRQSYRLLGPGPRVCPEQFENTYQLNDSFAAVILSIMGSLLCLIAGFLAQKHGWFKSLE